MSDESTRTSPPESDGTQSHLVAPEAATRTGAADAAVGDLGTLAQAPVGAACAVSVPGYEILSELGRGGMGVVYKARHLRLNRTVALKMVLGAGAADARAIIRFLAEAEAVAAVKHPHVVQVHDFGEANGHAFMALEYLAGGTLSDHLKANTHRESVALAALLTKIARGVAAAHELGIVHRDLKPANILMDETGDPKVTDFGLAKRGAGTDLTATQAVMGTPAYMSPEQAGGGTKFVGPQADVWALGVMLYELLTGTRPFDGDDVQAILSQILTAEPLSPRKRVASVPRDLELICLKCISKAPHVRYPTARELADDLDRFIAGKPISVRPAGPLERGHKWVKRNKAISGAMAAVFLALVIGSAVSITFGLEAKEQANRANGEATRADKERDAAIDARNDLKQANVTLEQTNEDLNGALASAYLGPIRTDNPDGGLTPYETNAFWELAFRRGGSVCPRFLEEATRSPLATRQLANRAEYALHATIGLDPHMRDNAERLLAERLRHPAVPVAQQRDLALACASLQGLSPVLAERVLTVLTDAIVAQATNYRNRERWAEGLVAVAAAGRMQPEAAAKTFIDGMARTANGYALADLAEGLAVVAGRMRPEAAASTCSTAARTLTNAMAEKRYVNELRYLAQGLAAVAGHLTPETAASTCSAAAKTLADALDTALRPGRGDEALDQLPSGLVVVAGHLTPDTAVAVAKTLNNAMTKTTNGSFLYRLAQGLAAVAGRMTPEAAAKTCSVAAQTLTDKMAETTVAQTTHGPTLRMLAEGLVALAERMTPGDAARTCSAATITLTNAMTKTTVPYDLAHLAVGLAAVVGRMTPEAAAKTCSVAAQTLTDAMSKTTDGDALTNLVMGLAAVAVHLEPETAALVCGKAAGILAKVLEGNRNSNALIPLAGLLAVAGRTQLDQAATALTDGFGLETRDRRYIAKALRIAACGISSRDRERTTLLIFGSFVTPSNLLPRLPLFHPHFHPQPKPLPPQTLVEVLKHPFCVGEARRAILDALEFTYNRSFADQWEFVEYAQKHQPQLDLLTPPKRPQSKP